MILVDLGQQVERERFYIVLLAHFVAHMRVPIWSLVLPSTAQRLASISFGTVAYIDFLGFCAQVVMPIF